MPKLKATPGKPLRIRCRCGCQIVARPRSGVLLDVSVPEGVEAYTAKDKALHPGAIEVTIKRPTGSR